jgi:hypothetical protein
MIAVIAARTSASGQLFSWDYCVVPEALSTAQINEIRWAVSHMSIVNSETGEWTRDGPRNVGTFWPVVTTENF